MSTGIIILIVVALLVIWVISIYNNLVKLRNNRENAFANIDVQLKQRYDLVPQLVSTVKGYAKHEKELLEKVTAARTAAMGATNINDKIAADNQLSSALAGLKVSVEAYPELKANQLPPAADRAFRHREQARQRASFLQLCHEGTQQCRSDLPRQYFGRYVRFPQGAYVRGAGRGACCSREGSGGVF